MPLVLDRSLMCWEFEQEHCNLKKMQHRMSTEYKTNCHHESLSIESNIKNKYEWIYFDPN